MLPMCLDRTCCNLTPRPTRTRAKRRANSTEHGRAPVGVNVGLLNNMSEFEKQLFALAFDKGLLALLIVLIGIGAKFYLDRMNTQNAYRQKLAEERLRAYKEISRVLSQQVMLVAQLMQDLESAAERQKEGTYTQEAMDKFGDAFQAGYEALRQSYQNEMPKLSADVIFTSKEVSGLLIKYIEAFGSVMSIPHKGARGIAIKFPEVGLVESSSQVQAAIANELASLRI